MELGAFGDGAFLEEDTLGAAMFEDLGIERERLFVEEGRLSVGAAGEVGGAEIGVHGGGIGRKFEGALIGGDGAAVAFLGVEDGAEIVDGLGVFGVGFDGTLVVLLGSVEVAELMVGDADLVEGDVGVGLGLEVLVNE